MRNSHFGTLSPREDPGDFTVYPTQSSSFPTSSSALLGGFKGFALISIISDGSDFSLTPRWRGRISHTYLWAGGFQQYHKSSKIGQKPFYSQVNDKEW